MVPGILSNLSAQPSFHRTTKINATFCRTKFHNVFQFWRSPLYTVHNFSYSTIEKNLNSTSIFKKSNGNVIDGKNCPQSWIRYGDMQIPVCTNVGPQDIWWPRPCVPKFKIGCYGKDFNKLSQVPGKYIKLFLTCN